MNVRRDTISYSPITLTILVGLITALFSYLYFLNMSVVEVVLRTEATHIQYQLNAEIAVLESAYIEAQHAIAAKVAMIDGYESDNNKLFVYTNTTNNLVAHQP